MRKDDAWMKNSDDIIRELLKNMNNDTSKVSSLGGEDIERIIKNTDKSKAMAKMRSMGLGVLADKLGAMSDRELLELLKNNPSILKKVNKFLK